MPNIRMGRIKTQLMKKTAEGLVELYGENLNANYNENKVFINTKLIVSSKKLKNAIIGYATHLTKLKKNEK